VDTSLFTGESNAFVITAIMMVGYEVVKNLVSMGLRTKNTVDEALWKKGVTDSLATLIAATSELKQHQNNDIHQGRK
jgi:hypothetical protein